MSHVKEVTFYCLFGVNSSSAQYLDYEMQLLAFN